MDRLIERLTIWNWRLTAAQTVIGAGLLISFWKSLPPEVPLLYSRPWGQDQLVSPHMLWLMPAIGCAMGVVVGLWGVKTQDKTLRSMLFLTTMVVQIILVSGLIRIVLLVS